MPPAGAPPAGPPPLSYRALKKALKGSPRGSGAAAGGGRFEHWRVVLAEPAALAAFCEVCDRVAEGRVPESAAAALALAKLTPLRKPGGGVRPIAAPNILRRLVGRALVTPRKHALAEALGRHQFAVGTAAGTELLAHSARALAEANPNLVTVALGAKNAYCTANREGCLRELELAAPELLPFANMFCRRESLYYFWDAEGACRRLRSTGGVDQGDPLAPLLFACGMRPRLRALEHALREAAGQLNLPPDDVHVLAYLDDVVVLVPAALAGGVQAAAQEALGDLGLELEPRKTQAWSGGAACPPGLEAQWRAEGITLVGVPLGGPLPAGGLPAESDGRRVDLGTPDYAKARCAETAGRAAELLAKLAALPAAASPHLPAAQTAGLLLRHCGTSKLTHLLRTSPPAASEAAAAAYDEALLAAYEEHAELDPLTELQQAQCRLPLRTGGRGLRSQRQLAPAAWAASWAQSLSGVRERTGLACLEDLEACALPLAGACRDALAGLAELAPPPPPRPGEEPAELPTWRELAETPTRKLQKTLTARIDRKNHMSLLGALEPEGRALLRSCGGPHASGWQTAAPGQARERLDDADYRVTVRCLLGQDAAPPGATCCNRARAGERAGQPCGAALCGKARHAWRCSRGGGPKARSGDLERAWQQIHAECGHRAERQVHVPAWDRWAWRCAGCNARGTAPARPPAACSACGGALAATREEAILDLEVQRPGQPRTFFDVTVRYSVPGDAESLAAAAGRDGAVNAAAEADKHRRYPAGQTPWRMVPLALETAGRHGQAALRHLRGLAREQAALLAPSADGDDSAADALAGQLVARWGRELSVALQRATARQLRTALGADHAGRAAALRAAEAA